jgi:hypothetical protein
VLCGTFPEAAIAASGSRDSVISTCSNALMAPGCHQRIVDPCWFYPANSMCPTIVIIHLP